MAEDEVEAHTGMFEPSTNDSYYALGLETAKIIREALSASHGVTSDEGAPHGVNGNQDVPTNQSAEGNLVDLWHIIVLPVILYVTQKYVVTAVITMLIHHE